MESVKRSQEEISVEGLYGEVPHAQSRGRYTMKNIWILFLILVFHVGPGQAQSELGPLMGSKRDQHYFLFWDGFGIEQFEGGKRTTHRFQLWDLLCEYPPSSYYGPELVNKLETPALRI